MAGDTGLLKLGTRGSALALAQAHEVQRRLAVALEIAPSAVEIVVIKTTGDRIQDRALSESGGKGLFTKELDQALMEGSIDFAVHSAKDLPTRLPEPLVISGFLPREDVRDAFISNKAASLAALPHGAVVGSASLRRQAQLRRLRPDLTITLLRGNVDTRLRKLDAGEIDAMLLALAGLRRLSLDHRATAVLDTEDFLPAVGQGAIAITARAEDASTAAHLDTILDPATGDAVRCERAFLDVLDGSCRTPIAGHARLDAGDLVFRGLVLSTDGAQSVETLARGPATSAEQLGRDAGHDLLARAPEGILAPFRAQP